MNSKRRNFCFVFSLTALLFAIGASPSSAEPTFGSFTSLTGSYPLQVHGVNGAGQTTFITEAGSIECQTTITGSLTEPSQTLTVTPTTSGCKLFKFFEVAVVREGCDYRYHIATRLKADSYQADFDFLCPEGKAMRLTVLSCELWIPSQANLKTIDFESLTGPQFVLTMRDTVQNVAYWVLKDGASCPFNGIGVKTGGAFSSHEPMTISTSNGIHIG